MSEIRPIRLQALLKPAPLPEARADAERVAARAAFIEQGKAQAEAALFPRIVELEAELAEIGERHLAEITEHESRFRAALDAMQAFFHDKASAIAMAIARAVLATEPKLAEETIRSLVTEVLAEARPGDIGTLRLHPEMATISPLLPAGWDMIADPELPVATAVAEMGPAIALASLERRLEQVRASIEAQQ